MSWTTKHTAIATVGAAAFGIPWLLVLLILPFRWMLATPFPLIVAEALLLGALTIFVVLRFAGRRHLHPPRKTRSEL